VRGVTTCESAAWPVAARMLLRRDGLAAMPLQLT
jgi:hypothetical protein